MNLHRLLRTTAIRLSLRYALLYALLFAVGLGVLYLAISRFIHAELEASLKDELAEFSQVDQGLGRDKLIETLNIESRMGGEDRRYFLLLAPDGTRLAGSILKTPAGVEPDGEVRNLIIQDELIPDETGYDNENYTTIAIRLDDGGLLHIAQNTHQADKLRGFILLIILIILPLSIILALTMGLFLGRTILARIDNVNTTASAIVAGELSRRVPLTGNDDEFDELARHLNSMLMRIEQLITGMRRVSDNIAHDLRHPLARLRNRLDVTLLENRDSGEYVEAIQQSINDADELLKTFNSLLEIAQTEAGSFRGEWNHVDLSALAQNLGELYQDVAEELGMVFKLQITPDIVVVGNRHLLAQAIRNLLENVIQYSAQGKYIELRLEQRNDQICLVVADHGAGIPAEQHDTVLERFARLESSRNSPGTGLGLSLVKAVADLHKAILLMEDNQPGLRVSLLFQADVSSV